MQQTMSISEPRRGTQLKMPVQAAPVDRTLSKAALDSRNGVEADGIFDDILGTVVKTAPTWAPALGGLLGI